MTTDADRALAKKGRMAGLVIAGAMVFWLVMQWLAVQMNLSQSLMLLIDLAVMAAMIWSLVVTYQIWRTRRDADKG